MTTIAKCPVCGGERVRPRKEITDELEKHGAYGVSMTPGGPRITYSSGKEIYLGGYCDSCDLEQVRKWAAKLDRQTKERNEQVV